MTTSNNKLRYSDIGNIILRISKTTDQLLAQTSINSEWNETKKDKTEKDRVGSRNKRDNKEREWREMKKLQKESKRWKLVNAWLLEIQSTFIFLVQQATYTLASLIPFK